MIYSLQSRMLLSVYAYALVAVILLVPVQSTTCRFYTYKPGRPYCGNEVEDSLLFWRHPVWVPVCNYCAFAITTETKHKHYVEGGYLTRNKRIVTVVEIPCGNFRNKCKQKITSNKYTLYKTHRDKGSAVCKACKENPRRHIRRKVVIVTSKPVSAATVERRNNRAVKKRIKNLVPKNARTLEGATQLLRKENRKQRRCGNATIGCPGTYTLREQLTG